MGKRFTDTQKWNNPWYRKLEPKMKCAFQFIYDQCDHAGIWLADFESLTHFVNQEVTQTEFETVFQGKVQYISRDKYFIPDFVEFQYGKLNPNNRVHASVMSLLQKERATMGLLSSYDGAKDKDKDKEKDKVKDKEKEAKPFFDVELVYKEYPSRPNQRKRFGMNRLNSDLKSEKDFADVLVAVKNYRAYVEQHQIDPKFIKQFATWAGDWREWVQIESEPGYENGFLDPVKAGYIVQP